MSDSSFTLNPGTGGDLPDAELISTVKRQRVQVGGSALAEIARVLNAEAVYNSYGLVTREAPKLNEAGRYRFVSALRVIPATADNGTSTAFFWIQNPVGNSKNARIQSVRVSHTTDATPAGTDVTGNPLLAYARFTFTGTASGAQLTAMKRRSTDAANSITIRTAVTGMTVTLGASGFAQPATALAFASTASVVHYLYQSEFLPVEDEGYFAEILPGEGIAFLSLNAGNGTSRVAMGQGSFLEYTP